MAQKVTLPSDPNEDFGFSFHSDDEIKKVETQLIERKTKEASEKAELAKKYNTLNFDLEKQLILKNNQLNDVMKNINVFLDKLAEAPEKTYVLWPDRAARVKAFKEKLESIIT